MNLRLVALSVVAASASLLAACSGAATDGTSTTTALHGVYTATDAGDFRWISFDADHYFAFVRSDAGCDADMVPAGCVGTGTYTVDEASQTLTLDELQTGQTYTYPLSITAGLPGALTDVASLVNDGNGGSIVSGGGSSLVSQEKVTLTQSDGDQSLVSSSGSPLICPSSTSAQQSESDTQCSSSSDGTTDPKSALGSRVHAAPTLGQMCRIGYVACKVLIQATHMPTTLPIPELIMPAPPPITMTQQPPP